MHRHNCDDLRITGAISIDLSGVLDENQSNYSNEKELNKRRVLFDLTEKKELFLFIRAIFITIP